MLSRLLSILFLIGLSAAPAAAQIPALRTAASNQPLETDPKLGPLLARGVEALQGQRLDEALSTFENMYRQSPRPTLLYYLGKVAMAQGRTQAAVDLYRRFLKGSGEEVDADTRLEVQQFLGTNSAPDYEVTVHGDIGALLSVDGRLTGSLPLDLPLLLSPGNHHLLLEKGRRKADTTVTLVARRRAEVRFTLIPPVALLTLTPGVMLITRMDPPALEPTFAPLLHSALQGAVAAQNAVLIAPEVLPDLLQRSPDLSGCLHQAACQERIGQMSSAQFVLQIDMQTEAGSPPTSGRGTSGDHSGTFRFTAKLLDVEVGLVSIQATQSCVDCNLKRALGQMADTVQELLRQAAARPRGTLQIDSDPPGAQVLFDGQTLGTTPYHREAFVGPHEIAISKPGHNPHSANINITDGETTRLALTLTPSQPPPPSGNKTRRILKWTLLGAGLATTITGIALLSVNGRNNFDGRSSGIPLLVIGLGSLTGSGVLFWYDRPAPTTPQPAASAATVSLLGF